MRPFCVVSILTVLCALAFIHPTDANFFSRLLKLNKEDDKPVPSGVASVQGSNAKVGNIISVVDGIPFAHLANNNKIPLVGIGVGNLFDKLVPSMVAEAIQKDKKSILIDTSHASNNEKLVAKGLLEGVEMMKLGEGEKIQVHVVTKVWYTHLGYERTKLSVQESLEALKPALESDQLEVHLHILLHWPRCFDEIPWMDCVGDEAALPAHVREAGPDPNKDPNAWKESWRLLEDMYFSEEYPIASIGVSNFHLKDLEVIDSFARIHPHILQVNLWSLLYDAHLVDYCHKHRIHVQVYNAMQNTIMQPEKAPRAYHHIQKVAVDMSKGSGTFITPAQVVLAWLIQHGVSVIPRTSKTDRLGENSAVSISSIPAFNDMQVEAVAHAVEAYMSGDDLEKDLHVSVTFHAVSKDIVIYWVTSTDEVRIAILRQGDNFVETTYPNHIFRTYDAQNKDVFKDHHIKANFGEHEDIHVEL
jgi:diketogulonate reductase-like aldo/keto reductase